MCEHPHSSVMQRNGPTHVHEGCGATDRCAVVHIPVSVRAGWQSFSINLAQPSNHRFPRRTLAAFKPRIFLLFSHHPAVLITHHPPARRSTHHESHKSTTPIKQVRVVPGPHVEPGQGRLHAPRAQHDDLPAPPAHGPRRLVRPAAMATLHATHNTHCTRKTFPPRIITCAVLYDSPCEAACSIDWHLSATDRCIVRRRRRLICRRRRLIFRKV